MVPGCEELLVRVQAGVGKTQEEKQVCAEVWVCGNTGEGSGIVKITLVRTSAI